MKLIRHDEQELTAVGTGEGSFVCATPSAEYSGSGLLDFVGLASPSADRVAERGEPCAEPDCPPDVFQDACAAPSHYDRSGADVSTSLPRSSTGAAAFPQPPGARAETVGVGATLEFADSLAPSKQSWLTTQVFSFHIFSADSQT